MAQTPTARAAKLLQMQRILSQMVSVNTQIDNLAANTEKQDLTDALSDLNDALNVVQLTLDFTHA
jgi:hypothetical protein